MIRGDRPRSLHRDLPCGVPLPAPVPRACVGWLARLRAGRIRLDFRMEQAVTIFLAGVLGVFLGIAMIYAAIRMTAFAVDRFAAKKDST